jgi:ferredoxin-NADP reductase
MPITNVKLTERREVAVGTMAFHFEKPAGFEYTAGQCCDLTLLAPPETDAEGNTRTFTLASAPFEDHLMVAMRMRDTAFKRVLKTLAAGTELRLDAPHGSFTLHRDASIPAVFLTGGIGITPARSIVLQATHDRLPHTIVLFNSNRRPEDAPFLDELTRAQTENPNFTLVSTMTEMEKSSRTWDQQTGFVSKAMIAETVPDLRAPVYYLCGPPGMVTAMRSLLVDAGVEDYNIRTEEFAGY